MNKRQKEVIRSQLNDEKAVLKDIKKTYANSLKQIDEKIAALLAREDTENLQSIIYQVDYQKALKAQISGILDTMNGEQFDTISNYLTACYGSGFMGTMYDLQGQGIPLILPIDQEQVTKAVQLDSKISEGLYKRLGQDVSQLKKTISSEVSRGVASALTYDEISRNIRNQSGITENKAYRIARTEGHRISNAAAYNAQKQAVENGADVVKQWDAALDSRTRPTHAQLDGQIRDIDEPFEIAGHQAMYPGGFGVAAEDCNCRCAVLQRAKWAIDEDEFATLKQRADFFGTGQIKEKTFTEFKKAYVKNTSLTAAEVKSLQDWSGIYGKSVNAYFYGKTSKLSEYEETLADNLHEALEKSTISKSKSYFRGSTLDIFGKDLDKVAADPQAAAGMKVVNKGFMSLSDSQKAAEMFSGELNGKTILYVIDVPAGTKGIDMSEYAVLDYEKETLLQDHTALEILKVTKTDNRIIFKCKVVAE